MVYLGLDFGTRRIGVAVSEGAGWAARGVTTIQRKGGQRDLEAVGRLVQEHEAGAVVMGLPLNMDGSEGRMAELARRFADVLGEHLGLPIHLFDERLSSFEADRVMQRAQVKRGQRKGMRDQVAAAVILEGWLETQQQAGEAP